MIKEFLSKAIVNGNKSTVLLPLRWFVGISISATIITAGISAPIWLIIIFSILSSLSALLFIFAYVYCLLNNPDSLRSEKYTIQKMAIQKGFWGDDIAGAVKIETKEDLGLLGEEPLKKIDSPE